MNALQNVELSKRGRRQKRASTILSWILGVSLLPAAPFFFMAGIATAMASDSGPSDHILCLIAIGTCLCWAVPVFMLVAIFIARVLRKKREFIKSIIIQAIPLILFWGLLLVFLLITLLA